MTKIDLDSPEFEKHRQIALMVQGHITEVFNIIKDDKDRVETIKEWIASQDNEGLCLQQELKYQAAYSLLVNAAFEAQGVPLIQEETIKDDNSYEESECD